MNRIGLYGRKGYGKTNWSFVRKRWLKRLARVWSSTFFNLEYEFIPLFDSWVKITSAILTIITEKVTLLFFSTWAFQFSVLENVFLIFFTRNKTWLCKNYNVYCDSKLLGERTNTNPELSVLWLHSFTHFTHEPLISLQQWEDICSVGSLLHLVFHAFLFLFVCFTMYMYVYVKSCFPFISFVNATEQFF